MACAPDQRPNVDAPGGSDADGDVTQPEPLADTAPMPGEDPGDEGDDEVSVVFPRDTSLWTLPGWDTGLDSASADTTARDTQAQTDTSSAQPPPPPNPSPPCSFPAVAPTATPSTTPMTPAYVGVGFSAIIQGFQLRDWSLQGVAASARVRWRFYDANLAYLCEVMADANTASPVLPPWPTGSAARIWQAWLADPTGPLVSTCGPVPTSVIKTGDMTDWVRNTQTGLGIGTMVGVRAPLSAAVAAAGGDWSRDWAPYVFGLFLRLNGVLREVGYAFHYARTCEVVLTKPNGLRDQLGTPGIGAGVGPPVQTFVEANPYYVIPL